MQHSRPCCCPLYHEAIELIGRRWTGAIVGVLIVEQRGLRFGELAAAVPELSDRLLSERMKELASAFFVYGSALLYGYAGSVSFSGISAALAGRVAARSLIPAYNRLGAVAR